MRFSVWDYSQIKIAQFNDSHPDLALDPTDIFIFTWFKSFATKTRSKTGKNGSTAKGMWTKTIDGVDYFNVRYEAIIKDFPILSFSSVKSIQRRFDKYVEGGIFEKIIVHAGKKGNFTYFAFTDLFWSFEYDNDNPEHKQTSADNSVKTNKAGTDNSVQTKQAGADSFVQTKEVSADNSVHTIYIHSTTSLNNSSATSSYSDKNISETPENPNTAAEEVFSKTVTALFGYNPCFSPNPFPALVQNFKACDLKETYLEEYLNWIFKELKPKCRNPDNFASYFYKSFTQPVYISKFAHNKTVEFQKTADKKTRQIICPVCGYAHDKTDYFCPNSDCRLSKDCLDSPADIAKEKAVYQLKKNDFEKYNEYQNQLNELMTKYPLSVQIINKDKKTEFDNLLSQLESKFLNIQIA